MVPQAIFVNIAKDPLFKEAVKTIRADPVYGRTIVGFPDQSVQVFNEVKKALDDMAGAADRTGKNFASATYGGLARDVRDAAKNASPDYKQAIERQAAYRQGVLERAQTGPLGKDVQNAEYKGAGRVASPGSSGCRQ
jgi:hypothetical protein